jgi:hypothetical protein
MNFHAGHGHLLLTLLRQIGLSNEPGISVTDADFLHTNADKCSDIRYNDKNFQRIIGRHSITINIINSTYSY